MLLKLYRKPRKISQTGIEPATLWSTARDLVHFLSEISSLYSIISRGLPNETVYLKKVQTFDLISNGSMSLMRVSQIQIHATTGDSRFWLSEITVFIFLLRWLDTVKKEMQHKPFDTPILCNFNLYSRNNDEYG